MDALQLIQLIVRYATERESEITKIRLVKFLYLADLYYARIRQGTTLTSWPWAFVHFGPYCSESTDSVDDAVEQGLIESRQLPSRYEDEDYSLYKCTADIESEIERELPVYVVSQLKWAIRKWADDTHGLLDYVYFNTEPMFDTRRGALLDLVIIPLTGLGRPGRWPEVCRVVA